MVIGVCGGGIAFALNLLPQMKISVWVWFGIAILGVFVAQFLAFHKKKGDFDKLSSYIVRAEHIENILTCLGNLRSEGVALRNDGTSLTSKEEVDEWIKTVDSWSEKVLSEIQKLSPSEASIFRTLDWITFPPFEHTFNPEHNKNLRMHSLRLINLKNLVLRYSLENLCRKSDFEQ